MFLRHSVAPIIPKLPPVMQIDSIIKDSDEIPEEQAIEVIEKAKVEDDEYKDQTGEQNYYGSVKIMHFLLICVCIFSRWLLCFAKKKQSTCLLFFHSIAHSIRETVTEQASIMVNGTLKEYQIKVSDNNFLIKWEKLGLK